MATLHLMVGLPCAGKTTQAKQLAQSRLALRLTPDEWQVPLFGQDLANFDEHNARHDLIEKLLWQLAEQALQIGTSVILDFGFWAKAERDDFRARAQRLGAGFEIHFIDVPDEILLARLAARNASLPAGVFAIPEHMLKEWLVLFQPPTSDELGTG